MGAPDTHSVKPEETKAAAETPAEEVPKTDTPESEVTDQPEGEPLGE